MCTRITVFLPVEVLEAAEQGRLKRKRHIPLWYVLPKCTRKASGTGKQLDAGQTTHQVSRNFLPILSRCKQPDGSSHNNTAFGWPL